MPLSVSLLFSTLGRALPATSAKDRWDNQISFWHCQRQRQTETKTKKTNNRWEYDISGKTVTIWKKKHNYHYQPRLQDVLISSLSSLSRLWGTNTMQCAMQCNVPQFWRDKSHLPAPSSCHAFSSVCLLWATHLWTLGRAYGGVQLKHWVLYTCHEAAGTFKPMMKSSLKMKMKMKKVIMRYSSNTEYCTLVMRQQV